MALTKPLLLPAMDNGLPFILTGAPPGHVHHQPPLPTIPSISNHHRPTNNRATRRKSSTQSTPSLTSTTPSSVSGPLRLADLTKHHYMGVHTEDWREDMLPVRQCLPMQHIIGSLKRDRDGEALPARTGGSLHRTNPRGSLSDDVSAVSPTSDDSFLHMLTTPKRRRTLDGSWANSPATIQNPSLDWPSNRDPDDHVPTNIPRSALPGLNHVLNLSTLTPNERNVFSEYAPKDLEDPQILMNEVLQLRDDMINDQSAEDDTDEFDDNASTLCALSPFLPPERDVEVRKAFEEFIDFNDSKRYIAKI